VAKYQPSLPFIAFLQATGLLIYCSLIGLLFWKGNHLFGPMPTLFGPVAFFLLFMISAVICALLYLGYPFLLFWEHKQTRTALHLVAYTTAWCALFVIIILSGFCCLNFKV
jgi:hypothetical protein